MDIYIPYTYLIGWTSQNLWYYGVRFANNNLDIANPNDLWKTYFTSSKYVEEVRLLYGEPDVIQIRKTFKEAESARIWEEKVLTRLDVINRKEFLNKTNNISIPSQKGIKKPKDFAKGSSNSMFGKKRPDISEMNKNRIHPMLNKSRPEHSKAMSGLNNPMAILGKGLLFWNNGNETIRSKECPGIGWTRGRAKKH